MTGEMYRFRFRQAGATLIEISIAVIIALFLGYLLYEFVFSGPSGGGPARVKALIRAVADPSGGTGTVNIYGSFVQYPSDGLTTRRPATVKYKLIAYPSGTELLSDGTTNPPSAVVAPLPNVAVTWIVTDVLRISGPANGVTDAGGVAQVEIVPIGPGEGIVTINFVIGTGVGGSEASPKFEVDNN